LDGEQLYNWNKDTITAKALMGPWKFNFTQSFICSVPGSILAGIVWIFQPKPAISPKIVDPVLDKIGSILVPFSPPFTLLLIVFAVAYCSLPSGRFTKANWAAAQRKYLYLDGSYGVFP
jgi:hypothetical protein